MLIYGTWKGRIFEMNNFIKLLKIEARVSFRSIDGVFFGIVMPMGIAILIGMISRSDEFIAANISGLMTVGICATAFMGIPLGIADYRDKKILKHYFVTPVSPIRILLVQILINMFTAIISSFGVFTAMKIFFGYKFTGNIVGFIGAYFLVIISMYGWGMFIASICKNIKEVNLVCTIVYFPMLFLSGATIPSSILPDILRKFADLLPLTQGINLLNGFVKGSSEISLLIPILVMIIPTVITSILAVKLFRWE